MSAKSAPENNREQSPFGMKPIRGVVAVLIVVSISGLLAILLAEISLRIFPTLQPLGIVRNEFCEGAAYRDSPNSIFFETPHRADGWQLHVNNNFGFRDVFDTGPVKAIILGDSFTRGSVTNNGEFYADLLDRWAPETGFRTFGHGGWGTGDQLLQYMAIADTTPHELVILGYYPGNDLTDNPKHGFSLQGGKISGPSAPVRPTQVQRTPTTGQKVRSILAKAEVYRFLRHNYYLIFERESQLADIERDSEALHELSHALMEELIREIAANNAKLLVFGIPSVTEVRTNKAPQFIVMQYEMLASVAEQHDHVEWMDMRAVFAEHDPHEIFAIDGHLGRFGQYLVAHALATKLDIETSDFRQGAEIVIKPDCNLVDEYIQKLEVFGPKTNG